MRGDNVRSFQADSASWLVPVITTDEAWASHFEPDTKELKRVETN